VNGLHWLAQVILAGVFLFTGAGKLLGYAKLKEVVEARSKGLPIGMSRLQAALLGLVEMGAAVCVLMPADVWPPHILVRLASGVLAAVMVGACVYHVQRRESAAPSVTLFLLAVYVIVGRWPR